MNIPGAEHTIINHEPCGRCRTAAQAVTYHTPVPDRNAYVTTWYSWEFGCGETLVTRLGEQRCPQCGAEYWCPRTGQLPLFSKRYAPGTVSRGGLGEDHAYIVESVIGNRLPQTQPEEQG